MKKSELINLIRETVEEARVAGQVTTRPGERKKYIKGQGWVWVKKDDVMPGSSNVAAVETESEGLDSIKRELDGIVVALQADNGEEYEYSFKGSVNYFSPISKQWNTLPLNDSMRKNPITIVSQLLQKTNTKEIEKPTGARENFVRAAELFDEFKGKFSNIFAYPNTMDVNEQGKPTLLRFTNNLLNAKKDLIAFDKFNKIEGDDTMSGLKVDDEAPIDVDKELSPSYSRKGVNVPDEGSFDDSFMSGMNRMDESKKEKLISGLRSVIKEVIEESRKK